jgi:hypothetical protein
MIRNIGNAESVIRTVVSLDILSLTVIGPQSTWGSLGIVPLATSAIAWCPPYSLDRIKRMQNWT